MWTVWLDKCKTAILLLRVSYLSRQLIKLWKAKVFSRPLESPLSVSFSLRIHRILNARNACNGHELNARLVLCASHCSLLPLSRLYQHSPGNNEEVTIGKKQLGIYKMQLQNLSILYDSVPFWTIPSDFGQLRPNMDSFVLCWTVLSDSWHLRPFSNTFL